jgi:hypothetical protein
MTKAVDNQGFVLPLQSRPRAAAATTVQLHTQKPTHFDRFLAQKPKNTRNSDQFHASPFQPEIEFRRIRPPHAGAMQTKYGPRFGLEQSTARPPLAVMAQATRQNH